MIWFYLTILAVLFQTQRNLLQKNLRGKLDTIAVSWARVFFILPFLLIALCFLLTIKTDLFHNLGAIFYVYCFGAAIAQIMGTLCLVELFSRRNFVIGIAYMKTDTIQVAILAAIFLSESIPTLGIVAIFMAVTGLILLTPSDSNLKLIERIFHKSAILGIGVGFFLSATTIFMKKAMVMVSLQDVSKILPVITVFIIYTIMQNIIYVVYESYHKKLKTTFSNIMSYWKQCSLIGIFSFAGTICWLGAFSLQLVAYVKVVAQLEILLSFFISHHFLKEKSTKWETIGIILLILSIVLILFAKS